MSELLTLLRSMNAQLQAIESNLKAILVQTEAAQVSAAETANAATAIAEKMDIEVEDD